LPLLRWKWEPIFSSKPTCVTPSAAKPAFPTHLNLFRPLAHLLDCHMDSLQSYFVYIVHFCNVDRTGETPSWRSAYARRQYSNLANRSPTEMQSSPNQMVRC
jgi:hypothetical protein